MGGYAPPTSAWVMLLGLVTMTQALLQQILDEAAGDPASAFARLWGAIADEHGLKQEALDRWRESPEAYLRRSDALHVALRDDGKLPEGLAPSDVLAALRALDLCLDEDTRGMPPRLQRCKIGPDDFWLIGRPRGFASRLAQRQPNHLQYWARHHWLCPAKIGGITIEISGSIHELASALERVLERGEVHVYVASFEDGIEPEWLDPKPRYRTESLTDTEGRWASVRAALEDAKAQHADIVVLPELTLCPVLRTRVEDWLETEDHGFGLVVPGSFHVRNGNEYRGEAVLLNARGRVVLTHHKLAPMLVLGEDEHDSVVEGVRGHDSLRLLPSQLGLIALAICLDYCEIGVPIGSLWEQVAPGLILVPSMSNSKTASAHKHRAKTLLIEHTTLTAIAIQPTDEEITNKTVCGLVVGQETEQTLTSSPQATAQAQRPPYVGGCYRVPVRPPEALPTKRHLKLV